MQTGGWDDTPPRRMCAPHMYGDVKMTMMARP